MRIKNLTAVCGLLILCCLLIRPAWADLDRSIEDLQWRWAQINYQLEGKPQLTAFQALIADAAKISNIYPDAAPAWIWNGIIKSTYAGAKGGLDALQFAKASKADLEQAIKLDPESLDGSAYTSLGALYFNVPGCPIGFGDDDKAEELLLKGLAINPDGIDSNYFYGIYLFNGKRYQQARTLLLKAQSAPFRPNRPLADAGRQQEIATALAKVQAKLQR